MDGLPVVVGTESIRLILSYDWTEGTDRVAMTKRHDESQKDASAERRCLLKVRWLEFDKEFMRCKGFGSKMIDVGQHKLQ